LQASDHGEKSNHRPHYTTFFPYQSPGLKKIADGPAKNINWRVRTGGRTDRMAISEARHSINSVSKLMTTS
jgi:hypothetical protein